MSEEGEDFIRAFHHPLWIMFTRLLIVDRLPKSYHLYQHQAC